MQEQTGTSAYIANPADIERRSMEIISETLSSLDITLNPEEAPVVMRVIHTSADFDYVENLTFSERAVSRMRDALRRGADIVTDTEMARAGINKKILALSVPHIVARGRKGGSNVAAAICNALLYSQ